MRLSRFFHLYNIIFPFKRKDVEPSSQTKLVLVRWAFVSSHILRFRLLDPRFRSFGFAPAVEAHKAPRNVPRAAPTEVGQRFSKGNHPSTDLFCSEIFKVGRKNCSRSQVK